MIFKLSRKNAVEWYTFILSVQIICLAYYITKSLVIPLPEYTIFKSVAIYFNPIKRIELLTYLISVISLGLFFISVIIIDHKIDSKMKRYTSMAISVMIKASDKKLFLISSFFSYLSPLIIYGLNIPFLDKASLQLTNFFILVLLPWFEYMVRYEQEVVNRWKKILLFWIRLWHKCQEMNTYLWNKLDIYILYCVKLQNCLFKKKFFYISIIVIGYIQLITIFYDPIINHPKIINEYMNVPETTILADGKQINNSEYFDRFNSPKKNQYMQVIFDTNLTKEWYQSNAFEAHWQILSRYMIHHNSFMFIPIDQFLHSHEIGKINAQYGLGSAWLFSKFFSQIGDVSFDGWLKVSYVFYYIYFGLYIFIVFMITRSWVWTAAIFLLSIALVNNRGYDFLLLSPGESPWRHCLDIVVVYSLFLYGETKKLIYYLLALTLSIIATVINPQIGIMIFMATALSGLFLAYREEDRMKTITITTLFALVITVITFIVTSSISSLTQYYLDGVIGFSINFWQMFIILFIIAIGYMLLWKIVKDRLSFNYIFLIFLFIYSQELIVYIIWHFNSDGLRSRAFIYVLTVALLLLPYRRVFSDNFKKRFTVVIFSIIGIVYVDSVVFVIKGQNNYEMIFKRHKVYDWDLDRAQIVSTMDPRYFKNSISLIQKYSRVDEGIYIISEYDNFLPFLAHRYSNMPFFDLKWYLMTPKELEECKELLWTRRPKYLFVDTALDRDRGQEVMNKNLPMSIDYMYHHGEAIWRAGRLELLYSIFRDVEKQYDLVEQGALISVYKKKDENETD